MVWGKMILRSNGLSYMDFKVHVGVNKAMDGVLMERSVYTSTAELVYIIVLSFVVNHL